MDTATAETMIKLWLEDIDVELGNSSSSQDVKAALQVFQKELSNQLETVISYQAAVQLLRDDRDEQQQSRAVVLRALREEDVAAQDHELACRLAGQPMPTATRARTRQILNECASNASQVDEDELHDVQTMNELVGNMESLAIASFAFEYDSDVDEDPMVQGESSMSKSKVKRKCKGKGKAVARPLVRCTICGDNKPHFDVVELSCGHPPHIYCRACITGLFETSMSDTSLFPPRCCKIPISMDRVQDFFTRDFVTCFEDQLLKHSTTDRTYCAELSCGKFIKPMNISQNIATCSACLLETCSLCKRTNHTGPCLPDKQTQQIIDMAKENNWQQCSRCKQMIELTIGCYHMRCPCSYQFCYLCGERWKTCSCVQWEERRLLLAAEARVNDADDQPIDQEAREAAVREEARNIRENHDCEHDNPHLLRRHTNPGGLIECEGCHDELQFVMACVCGARLCRRCIMNRQ